MRFLIQNRLLRSALVASLCAAPFAAAMTPSDLSARLARNERLLLVDTRGATAYAEGHIPGAINIPVSLLPHKPLPVSQLVVVYGDGLGVVDDAKALVTVRAQPGINAELLEGGYVSWVGETRLSTSAAGVHAERIPGITYDQLVATTKTNVVLVDLRSAAAPAATVSAQTTGGSAKRPATAAAPAPDLLEDFARKIGVTMVAPTAGAPAPARSQALAANGEKSPARAAAAVESIEKSDKLLVLVADDETAANEAARQLRARGQYRFTVLIGGTESIRHEGKTGSGRMDGGLPVNPNQR